MHYSTVSQAQQDKYYDFDPKLDVSKGGIVYPFTGLRGDAKELYRKIKRNQEDRVLLVRADTVEEQAVEMNQSDIVIFSCGYEA